MRLFAHHFDVERAVKDQREQARSLLSGLMLHHPAGREVGVGKRAYHLAVDVKPTLEHDDGVSGGVAVNFAFDAGWVPNDIVLIA